MKECEETKMLTPEQKEAVERFRKKGRRVILTGFSAIFTIIAVLYAAYFYLEAIDPTKALYFYPPTKSEFKDKSGLTYKVENIFPSYNHYNFFQEKMATNYKTTQDLIGKKLDIRKFRDTYEFAIMKKPENDLAIKYGVYRYYIYNLVNDKEPKCTLYVNSSNIVIGVTSPYLVNAEFKDITLSGANFAEVTRLNEFMKDKDNKDSTFTNIGPDLYVAASYSKEKKDDIYPVYVASIHSKKKINSILNLIDFYEIDQNYVTINFSTFLDKKSSEIYQNLLKLNR